MGTTLDILVLDGGGMTPLPRIILAQGHTTFFRAYSFTRPPAPNLAWGSWVWWARASGSHFPIDPTALRHESVEPPG